MIIKDRKVMVFGGWGLVGMAVCRKILERQPAEIVLLSLRQTEAEEACDELRKEFSKTRFTPVWGDIFVRESLKDIPRAKILADENRRRQFLEDTFEKPTPERLHDFYLHKLLLSQKPEIVIDCVNSATGLAYQDVYTAYYDLKPYLFGDEIAGAGFQEIIQKFIGTVSLPQLIRHIQVLHDAMRAAEVHTYVKIGTTGTGGMGLNIPYTHSEERPSGQLLSKSALAGAHSLLLFLLGRTPGAPYVKEIKPAAVIAWKKIAHGEIHRGGKPIPLFDCTADKAEVLNRHFLRVREDVGTPLSENLKSVYIDTGENGIFSAEEFFTITATDQMEYVTPEEIAQAVVWEIEGGNSGFDIVGALDSVVMGPTYRAGILREAALQEMQRLQSLNHSESIAFEMLGPPHLSKLLYEAHLIRIAFPKIDDVSSKSPQELSTALEQVIANRKSLRAAILSIGVPILLSDGKRLLRGPEVKIPAYSGSNQFEITDQSIDEWSNKGWVDLRPANMQKWQERIARYLTYSNSPENENTSSAFRWESRYNGEDDKHFAGKIVTRIFIDEENGGRIKP